jgi:hypothetical protein
MLKHELQRDAIAKQRTWGVSGAGPKLLGKVEKSDLNFPMEKIARPNQAMPGQTKVWPNIF